MTDKKENKLTARQVQAINTATMGVFNGLQQIALLKVVHALMNPELHEDLQPHATPAVDSEKEQQKRFDAEVERSQREADAINNAQATPNVLNQGNVDEVVESTRAAVAARDPEVVKEKLAKQEEAPAKAPAKKTK